MATGLEALGAASAVIQLISFAGTIISQCTAIYDGKPTPNDSLEEYVQELGNVATQVGARCGVLGPSLGAEERKVSEIARKCQSAAQDLQAELKHLTKIQRKGQLSKAIHAVVQSSRHQGKLRRLEQNLIRHKEVLETHLLSYICTQARAIDLQQSHEFQKLSIDVQDVVQQIAQGRTQLECMITSEHGETRTIIKKEITTAQERTGDHISSELQKLSLATTTASQRQRFLESLKSQDLNQRYNDILEPEDATFERIFVSYENLAFDNDSALSGQESCDSGDSMREIDQAWEEFINWLQTSEPIFWVRGKPGSGKSTLMKFIVNSTNTKYLLANWNSEVTILSHYFWKIGSQPQNSIKGLLCSLCYQILKSNHDIISYVLNSWPHMSSYNFYHDWSLQEVKTLLFMVLDYGKQHFCIFIDGLDEVCNKEGQGNIMDIVTQFTQHQRVKICVSSRPETGLIQRLEKLKSPGLKLELLTGHDMYRYVQQKLRPLREDETISASAFSELVGELAVKADGVFLWLYLATKSILDGASQGDSEEELLLRLQQIPAELEELYAEMWKRLNHNMPIYQQTAAELFHYTLNPRSFSFLAERHENTALDTILISTPLVFQIACARSFALQEAILLKLENIDDMEFLRVCEKVENDIRIRCAGLLEIQPRTDFWKESWLQRGPGSNETLQWVTRLTAKVSFIHRTAHDYLLGTEAGQNILRHNPIPSTSQKLAILRGTICMAYVLSRRVRLWINMEGILRGLLTEISSNTNKQMSQSTSDILIALNDAYNHGCIRDNSPLWWPRRLFLSHLAAFTVFDDFVISSLKEASVTTAEAVSRNIWEKQFWDFVRPSTRLVEELIALGTNWHSYGICLCRLPLISLVQQGTAFTRLLIQSLSWRSEMFPKGSEAMNLLQIVLGMAYTCPSLDRSTLVYSHVSRVKIANGPAWLRHSVDQKPNASLELTANPAYLFYEVELRFILRQLVIRLVAEVDVPPSLLSQVQEITTSHEEEPYKLRLVFGQEVLQKGPCYKALVQEPFTALNAAVFDYGLRDADLERQRCEKIYNEYCKLRRDASIMEPVPYKDSLYALAKEGLDICTAEDAGIACPKRYALR